MYYSFYFGFCILFIFAGCSDETPFEPQDSVPVEVPDSLPAIHFPTADGCSWRYVSADGKHAYTAKISGTRNMGGLAVRIMQTDSDIPVDSTGSAYGFPVRNVFFTKDLNSYIEYAFELWLDFAEDTYFQKESPERVVWSFPLYVGKEWTVSKSYGAPEIVYTRKVISKLDVIVPSGDYRGAYYVEEYFSMPEVQAGKEIIAKYWLAPDTGVIKYEFVDLLLGNITSYELEDFRK